MADMRLAVSRFVRQPASHPAVVLSTAATAPRSGLQFAICNLANLQFAISFSARGDPCRRRRPVSRSRDSRPPGGAGPPRAAGRRGLCGGRASQSVPRLLDRIRRAPRIHAGRRSPLSRLEGARPHRQVLPEAVRRRDEPRLQSAPGHQREHVVPERAAPMSKLEYAKCAAARWPTWFSSSRTAWAW